MSQSKQAGWRSPSPEELDSLLNEFKVVELLGRGGMGAVYRATQIRLEREVAIKVLPPELADDPEFEARFRREAFALARLTHPNIVSVHDLNQTAEGHYYIVMEFVDGPDLRQQIHQSGLPNEKALDVFFQICDALDYAHSSGYVHRDIKPANILLSSSGQVKVGDFGLTKIVDPEFLRATEKWGLTETGVRMGTEAYAAPEQMDAGPIDQRADIFSLGVVLYELLTQQLPKGAFVPPSKSAEIDKRLDGVVEKAMQMSPESRYQSTSEFRTDVERICNSQAQFSKRSNTRKRFLAIVALLAFIALLAASIPFLFNSSKAPSEPVIPTGIPFTNSAGIKMIWCESGEFVMGSPETEGHRHREKETQHPVTLTRGFWLAETETTQEQWEAVTGETMFDRESKTGAKTRMIGKRLPIHLVNWNDATRFCELLTKTEREAGRLPLGYAYRLPSEAQWEYACRAGTETVFSYGDACNAMRANFNGSNPFGDAEKGPALGEFVAVASYEPNPWGFYDLHGNGHEWCWDWYEHSSADPEIDPLGPERGTSKVRRGGAFTLAPNGGRSASRNIAGREGVLLDPEYLDDITTFRVALVEADPDDSAAMDLLPLPQFPPQRPEIKCRIVILPLNDVAYEAAPKWYHEIAEDDFTDVVALENQSPNSTRLRVLRADGSVSSWGDDWIRQDFAAQTGVVDLQWVYALDEEGQLRQVNGGPAQNEWSAPTDLDEVSKFGASPNRMAAALTAAGEIETWGKRTEHAQFQKLGLVADLKGNGVTSFSALNREGRWMRIELDPHPGKWSFVPGRFERLFGAWFALDSNGMPQTAHPFAMAEQAPILAKYSPGDVIDVCPILWAGFAVKTVDGSWDVYHDQIQPPNPDMGLRPAWNGVNEAIREAPEISSQIILGDGLRVGYIFALIPAQDVPRSGLWKPEELVEARNSHLP
ncbi:MAG: bifunctional serine/threonine-protein kinase/formylglycine-generating enzyme family protein [Verrucomicrobiota bacterium]